MTRKKTGWRQLSALLTLGIVLGVLSVAVLAEGDGDEVVRLDLSNGPITITQSGYKQNAEQETAHTGAYFIEQSGGAPTDNTITVESGTVELTISGLQVQADGDCAIRVMEGAELDLVVEGENSLAGGAGFAAIGVEPAYQNSVLYDADASARLCISGGGSLTAVGGNGDPGDTFGGGAGIGGDGQDVPGNGVDFGTVVISSDFTGTLNAVGGAASASAFGGGAGIGGGGFSMYEAYYWGNVAGQIEIHGGQVIASSNGNGAGIGGGGGQGDLDSATSAICVTITGGTVEATGGTRGAGIGGGGICDGGVIDISGGVVRAIAGPSDGSMGGAGIGGGNDASVTSVTIRGGAQVTAVASGGAAGIGGGTNTTYSNVHYGDVNGELTPERAGVIAISGEGTSVYAYGGTGTGAAGDYGGAGIGSGYPIQNNKRSVAFRISITDGASVRAYGGYHAQAIGYGYRCDSLGNGYTGYGITLELDDTIFLWAQNADCYQPALAAPTDYEDAPVSYFSDNDIYLVHYIDKDKNASSLGSSSVPGYLQQPAAADSTFDWAFDEAAGTVSIGPVTVVDGVSDLKGNWATLCTVEEEPEPESEPISICLADLIIYVGGEGYESVMVDQNGETVNTQSDGLPEPGFTVELPAALDAALKKAAGHTGEEPLDLSDYLSFFYDDGEGVTRTWTLERYDNKPGNTSMADGRYIYRVVPAAGQDPIQLQFTDEEGVSSNSDDFEIVLTDQYQVYEMSIYPGALDPAHLRAVLHFPDGTLQTYALNAQSAQLIIRGVVDEGDPTTQIVTTAPVSSVENITAQVSESTLFYINQSALEVQNWNAVELLADHIVPEAQDVLLDRALTDFDSRLTAEYKYEFRYLDLVDTSNGNVWVTANEPVTVYWPYPEGTDQNTEFFVVHYHDLDRQYDEDLQDKEYETTLYAADARAGEDVLENTDQGIRFTVDSFSPFALFWTEESDDPSDPSDPSEPDEPDEPGVTPGPGASEPPAATNTPEPAEPGTGDLPQTGDTARGGLWALAGLCGVLGLAALRKSGRGRAEKRSRRDGTDGPNVL